MKLFHPSWIDAPNRWGLGLRLACPVHIGCWLELYFANPLDGFKAKAPEGATLYFQDGGGLGTLSLYPRVELGEHGEFWLRKGCLVFRLQ